MSSVNYSIFFHNYYGEHEKWVQFFAQKIQAPFHLYYNVAEDSLFNQEEAAKAGGYSKLANRMWEAGTGPWLQKIILRRSPNQGKDIGGKLVLLDASIRNKEQSEYFIFLHDKKSPYKAMGQDWQDKLFRILEPEFFRQAVQAFQRDRKIGIIAGKDSIYNEYSPEKQSFISNNHLHLAKLKTQYHLNNTDHRFVAGTMFWAQSAPILGFFRETPPLEIRKTLETGNIMDDKEGTFTHTWERLLTWLIFARGYSLKGL